MDNTLVHKTATGAIWATIDRFGNMALQFIVNLVLARLLMPDDFGAIGMLAIFIAVSQVIIDGGFGNALIQKKNPSQTDYSTIFYWNIGLSTVMYSLLYAFSPYIAIYFKMPILSDVLRAIGLILITTSIISIQTVRLRKQLAFKTIAITNLGSYITASGLAIYLAYIGWGVWSLVLLQITSGIMSIILYWFQTRWHPSLTFSIKTICSLFSFGGYLFAAGILQEVCKNLQGIIIGKKFSATQMGYYSQAYKLDIVCSYSIPQVIVQVMFPVYSSIQDDKQKLIAILSMNIRIISLLIFPLMGLLILIAEPLINALYGKIWLPCVPYFQILCIGGLFVCLQNINFYAVAAVGRSRNLFLWSFYKWGFLLAALLIGINWGIYGLLWGMVLSSLNIYLINAYLAFRFVGISIINQIINILINIALTFIAFTIAWTINSYFNLHFIIMSIIFTLSYLVLAYGFKNKGLFESINLAKRLIK